MSAAVTIFDTVSPAWIGKKQFKNAGGQVQKETVADLYEATYQCTQADSGLGLAVVLTGLKSNQVLTASVPVNGSASGRLVSKALLAANPGAITRAKEAWTFTGGPAWLTLDYDPAKGEPVKTPDELKAALLSVCPALAGAAVVHWFSASSFIFDGDREVSGLGGQRVYVLVTCGFDLVRAAKALAQRFWLAGFGYIRVSKNGSLLERDLFDHAMWQPGRLDFIAGAHCLDGLEQRRGDPTVWFEGVALDSLATIPSLTPEEVKLYQATVAQAKGAAAIEAGRVREAYDLAAAADLTAGLVKAGVQAVEAERRARDTIRVSRGLDGKPGVLLGDFVLTVVHEGGTRERVTVAHVLSQRQRYTGKSCLVPMNEGHRDGSPDAVLFLMEVSPVVFSFDDGGGVFRLRVQRTDVTTGRGARAATVEALAGGLVSEHDLFMTDTGICLLTEKA